MQVRLAPQVASKVESVRLQIQYKNLADTVNLLLDSIKFKWSLNLATVAQIESKCLRVRIDQRHYDWITQYGTDRGISLSCCTNLLLSEFFMGNQINPELKKPESVPVDPNPVQMTQNQPNTAEKPKGTQLLKSLKL